MHVVYLETLNWCESEWLSVCMFDLSRVESRLQTQCQLGPAAAPCDPEQDEQHA